MSVYKPKGSPFYRYDFWYKGDRYHGSTGVTEREEAKAIESGWRTKAARAHAYGEPSRRPAMTVDEVFGRYWREKSAHNANPNDDMTRFALMAAHLGPSLPFQDLDDDRIAALVGLLRARRVGKVKRRLVSNATVNRDIEALRRVWKRAAKIWKIEHGDEPAWGQHLLPEADERVRELTAEEDARLFAALRDDYQPIARFALLSGLRIGNLRNLEWTAIDYDAMVVKVMLKSRKQGGRNHIVPITQAMLVLLANQRGKHEKFVFAYRCLRGRGERKKETWLPFTRDGWRRAWAKALKAAGLRDFRFHDTRHTAATRTLRASGNIRAVQKMLGHTKVTTTTRYAHALTDDIREAMEKAQSRACPEADSGDAAKDQASQDDKAAS